MDKWTLGRWKEERPERRWRARWRDARGAQRSKDFRVKKAAEEYERKMRLEKESPSDLDITVNELAARFLKTKEHLAPKTREMYANGVQHVLRDETGFSGQLASDVKNSDVRVWVAGIAGSGSLRQQAVLTLSGMFDLLVHDGDMASNPCDGVNPPRGEPRDPVFLTPDELVRLAEHSIRSVRPGVAGEAAAASENDELMILLMGTTALRIDEAARLKVSSINFSRGRGRVTKTKGKKARDVPIPADVAGLLSDHVKGRGPDDQLFLSPTGVQINPRNWRERIFYPAAIAAGLTEPKPGAPEALRSRVKPHDLRHTAVSLAIAGGADPKAIQEMVGHTKISMTMDLYGHLWPGKLDDVAVRMNAMLKGPLTRRLAQSGGLSWAHIWHTPARPLD